MKFGVKKFKFWLFPFISSVTLKVNFFTYKMGIIYGEGVNEAM